MSIPVKMHNFPAGLTSNEKDAIVSMVTARLKSKEIVKVWIGGIPFSLHASHDCGQCQASGVMIPVGAEYKEISGTGTSYIRRQNIAFWCPLCHDTTLIFPAT